ncbi:hypothetical protein M885DRAFT_609867 [Pelagophyceae sp. CCMP2097]|nr:hypothetical protein M885DRAFT_609867 [Pelagophyceae sp. CCMP2097]
MLLGGSEDRLVPGDRGRRSLRGPPTNYYVEPRPAKHFLAAKVSAGPPPQGKRSFPQSASVESNRQTGRLHDVAQQRTGYDAPEKTRDKKRNPVLWDGVPAQNFIPKELTLEVQCGLKHKVGSLLERRNGLGGRVRGDKAYAAVECSVDYYKAEGRVPGSCIRDWRGATLSKATDDFSLTAQRHYELKKRREADLREKAQISTLVDAAGDSSDEEDRNLRRSRGSPRSRTTSLRSPRSNTGQAQAA